ncbi:MAG TPA: heavy metal-associated domain-containing protein [Flavobacterium sp.]|jgi:copper chaperone CopZ
MKISKSIITAILVASTMISCKDKASENKATATKQAAKTQSAPTGKIANASFKIEGMSCAVMCASKIEKELAAMDGVQKATVDFETKTATVQFDDAKQSPGKLAEKVESVADGKTYKVSDIKTMAGSL